MSAAPKAATGQIVISGSDIDKFAADGLPAHLSRRKTLILPEHLRPAP